MAIEDYYSEKNDKTVQTILKFVGSAVDVTKFTDAGFAPPTIHVSESPTDMSMHVHITTTIPFEVLYNIETSKNQQVPKISIESEKLEEKKTIDIKENKIKFF